MSKAEPWFLEPRAEALAIILLTRRDDLEVRRLSDRDYGVDLVVELKAGDRRTGRLLGVQLKAQVEPLPAGKRERFDLANGPAVPLGQTLPICAFLFTMRDEQAYYAWIAEPQIEDSRAARLRSPIVPALHPLDNESLDRIVQRVNQWYEALAVTLAA